MIEKEQLHGCVLIERMPEWRQAFIDGVYNGWLELIKIPIIKYNIEYFSKERIAANNIMKQYPSNSDDHPISPETIAKVTLIS